MFGGTLFPFVLGAPAIQPRKDMVPLHFGLKPGKRDGSWPQVAIPASSGLVTHRGVKRNLPPHPGSYQDSFVSPSSLRTSKEIGGTCEAARANTCPKFTLPAGFVGPKEAFQFGCRGPSPQLAQRTRQKANLLGPRLKIDTGKTKRSKGRL